MEAAPEAVPPAPGADPGIGRRALIARAAAGVAVWTAPVVLGTITSPAGAITGVSTAPPVPNVCRTVNHQTQVVYAAPTGYAFTAHAVSTSCSTTIALTVTGPSTTVTLSFPKQTVHYVRLVLEPLAGGGCFLAVFEVTSPNPNGSPCSINALVGSSTCASPVSGSPCGTPQRIEPGP